MVKNHLFGRRTVISEASSFIKNLVQIMLNPIKKLLSALVYID